MAALYYILFLFLPVTIFLVAGLALGADGVVLALICTLTLIALISAIVGETGPDQSIR